MSKGRKRNYSNVRHAFKNELITRCNENKALAMLIIETYSSWCHRRHIHKIWNMFLDPEYESFRNDYTENLMGEHLMSREDIWRSLYFTERDLYEKYRHSIPETLAMGDAVGIAYLSLNHKR